MRKGSYILALALMGVLALVCSPASAQYYSQHHSGVQVDVGIFYDDLAPYGEWIEMPDYGWSWAPRVERGWRPYTRGQWVMTDDGWFWDSDEEFGWAAYHYGRWVNDPYYGWIWVPGIEWAPAWVSWRHGHGYTGWAPLPPRVTWRTRIGLSFGGLDIDAFIGADDYAFVQDRVFVDRGVYQRVLPPAQNVSFINATRNVTNYAAVNDRVFNGGIPIVSVERAVGRRVPRARTIAVERADVARHAKAGEIAVFRPEVRAAPERRPAQGRSLVKGDQPPPLLVERRREREQERQQKGNEPGLTAKDVAQRRQTTPRTDAKTEQQQAQRQRDQVRQDADKQRAKDQDQQRNQQQLNQQRAKQSSDAKAQADKRAKDAQQVRDQKQSDQRQRNQQQVDQQRAKQSSDAKAQADKRAKDAQQVRDQKQSNQQQANQQRANQQQAKQQQANQKQANQKQANQKQANQQQANQQQANQKQAKQQQAKQASDATAQADKRAKDGQQAAKDKDKKNR